MIKIKIDESKCTTPFDCKKCVTTCPTAIFQVTAFKSVKFKENDPKEPGVYKLEAVFLDKCLGCNECIEVCPKEAINLTVEA